LYPPHRRLVHDLIQVRPLRTRDVVFGRLFGRALRILAGRTILRIEAMDALLDVDHLRYAAIRYGWHESRRLIGRNIALLGEKFDGLRLDLIPCLVEILIKAHADPRRFGFDARKIEWLALDHLNGDVELLVGGLDRREVDFAVALPGMRVARPQQGTGHMDGHVERRPLGEVTNIQVAGIFSGRHRAVSARLLAGHAEHAGERPERNLDAGKKLGDLPVPVEI